MIVGDVAEQQRRGERRRRRRIDGGRPGCSRALDPAQRVDERRHVEDVAQALAVGLEQDRERAEARRDAEQVRGALALLPERRAPPGPAPGQEQRARGRLAEPARRRARVDAELPDDQRFDLVRCREHQRRVRRLVGLREPHHEAVVGPHGLDVEAGRSRTRADDGHAPTARGRGRRTARARRRASRRARRGTARRRSSGRRAPRRWLPPGRRDSGAGSPRPAGRGRARDAAAATAAAGAACSRSSRTSAPMRGPSSSGRPGASAFQNGILPGSPGAGVTSTRSWVISSMRQVEAPSRNVSPDAALEDHLLVELADAAPAPAAAPARKTP